MTEPWEKGLKAPLIFGLAFPILPRKAVFPLPAVTPLMPLGSSPNETSRWVGGFPLPSFSPLLSLSREQPLLGLGCLAPLLPPSTGLAAFSGLGPQFRGSRGRACSDHVFLVSALRFLLIEASGQGVDDKKVRGGGRGLVPGKKVLSPPGFQAPWPWGRTRPEGQPSDHLPLEFSAYLCCF